MNTRRDRKVLVRISAALRDEIELAADEQGRSISDATRRILLDWATARVVARNQAQAA